jgi:hypothetical protein
MSFQTRMYAVRLAPMSLGSIVHLVKEHRTTAPNKAAISC